MKKMYKLAVFLMVALFAVLGPNVFTAQTATSITAEAASSTSVKQLAVGKSYTISGYAKVKSSKSSIATSTKKSSKKYTIKAKKKGKTTLKCYDASGNLVKTVYLITTNSSSFKYDTTAITLTKGKTKTVKATVQSGCTVKYSSSNKNVASVNSKGKITAKKKGTATISAKVYYKGQLIKTLKKKVTVQTASSTKTFTNHIDSNSATTVKGGFAGDVTVWYANATDSVEFKLDNDNAEIENIEGPYYNYDSENSMNGYRICVTFAGRKQGTSNLSIYINGSLFKTVVITVTSTDTDYLAYVAWRKSIESTLWSDSRAAGLTDIEKISMVIVNVYNKYGCEVRGGNVYALSNGLAGNEDAFNVLACAVAKDLGYEGIIILNPTATDSCHNDAQININGVYYIITQTGYVYDGNLNPIGYGNVTEEMRNIL